MMKIDSLHCTVDKHILHTRLCTVEKDLAKWVIWSNFYFGDTSKNLQKPHQDSTGPYASPAGVVEDRSVLIWFLMVPMDHHGHGEQQLFSTLPPEMAQTLSKPVKTPPVLMPPCLGLWRTGVS